MIIRTYGSFFPDCLVSVSSSFILHPLNGANSNLKNRILTNLHHVYMDNKNLPRSLPEGNLLLST